MKRCEALALQKGGLGDKRDGRVLRCGADLQFWKMRPRADSVIVMPAAAKIIPLTPVVPTRSYALHTGKKHT